MNKDKPIFVGILEENKNSNTYKFAGKFLSKNGYRKIYKSRKDKISYYTKDSALIVLVRLEVEDLSRCEALGLAMDVLIHSFLRESTYEKNSLKEKLRNCKYYILNSDDENWTKLPLKELGGIIISYGFNSKSTLTVSSYNLETNLRASIYLQRELVSFTGRKIEPFEFSIETEQGDKNNIYSLIGISALALILGYREPNLKI